MSLNVLINTRKYVRASITRLYNARDNFSDLNVSEKLECSSKLNQLLQDARELNSKIQIGLYENDEQALSKELEECESYEDKIRAASVQLSLQATNTADAAARSLLKSPTAPLPKFKSVEGENLELFLRSFEDTISKFNYPDYDKFLLLKQQISGKASLLIDTLEPEMQTYLEAKNLLSKALATTSLQKFNVLKQLS